MVQEIPVFGFLRLSWHIRCNLIVVPRARTVPWLTCIFVIQLNTTIYSCYPIFIKKKETKKLKRWKRSRLITRNWSCSIRDTRDHTILKHRGEDCRFERESERHVGLVNVEHWTNGTSRYLRHTWSGWSRWVSERRCVAQGLRSVIGLVAGVFAVEHVRDVAPLLVFCRLGIECLPLSGPLPVSISQGVRARAACSALWTICK